MAGAKPLTKEGSPLHRETWQWNSRWSKKIVTLAHLGCLEATHFYKWPNLHLVTILNLHHSQGALKFATLFSPLLNLLEQNIR